MAQNSVNVRIGAKEEVSGASKKAVKAIRGLGSQSRKTGKQILKTWSQATIVIAGVARAWRAMSDRVVELVDLYGEQENAENKLRRAVENNPLMNGDGARSLAEYAAELQTVSRFGDEALVAQQAFVASLGYSEEQIRRITLAAVELASTGQVGLDSAFRNVTKTMSGVTGELGELIPGIKDLGKEALIAGEGVEYIIDQFGGMKDASIEGIEGFREQVGNLSGDIKEKLGKVLVEIFEGSGGRGILDYLKKIDEWLADNETYIISMFQLLPELADISFSAIGDMLSQAFSLKTTINGWKAGLGLMVDLAKNEFSYIGNMFKAIFDRDYTMEDAKKEYFGGFAQSALNWLERAPLDFSEELDQAMADMDAIIKKNAEALDAQREAEAAGSGGTKYAGYGSQEEFDRFSEAAALAEARRTPKAIKDVASALDLLTSKLSLLGKRIENVASIIVEPRSSIRELNPTGGGRIPYMEIFTNRLGDILEAFKTGASGRREGATVAEAVSGSRFARGISSGDAAGFLGNGALNALANVAGTITNVFKQLSSGILGAIQGFASVVAIMNPLQTIISAAVQVLAPIINDLLSPLVGILAILGQTIGQILQPALEALSPVIEFLSEAFVWIYNKAIVPLGNGITEILVQIATAISWMVQKIKTGIHNMVEWLSHPFNEKKRDTWTYDMTLQQAMDAAFANGKANPLSEINLEDLDTAGQEYMGSTGGDLGGVPSTTTVQRQPDINVYISADSVNGSGGMAEFGRLVADAIVEYTNVGGRVEFLEA